jgi:SAM-dependent methyltransferase
MNFHAIRLQSWYTTPQGDVVKQLLGDLFMRWLSGRPEDRGCTLGFGYTQPYLNRLALESGRSTRDGRGLSLVGVSPAEMGVMPWPKTGNCMSLVRPDLLPFAEEAFSRVIMVHLLEGAVSPHVVLRETWRVLEPGGRLLLVVPNRGGWWARSDQTPFGWGRPFSPRQIGELLQEAFFVPRQSTYALFVPPFTHNRLLQTAETWEKAGQRWFAPLGGVVVTEAEKVIYALRPLDYGWRATGRRRFLPGSEQRPVPATERDAHLQSRRP